MKHHIEQCVLRSIYPIDISGISLLIEGDGDLMKMHAFTAKTGEPSHERPKPTYLPSTTKGRH